MSTIKKRTFSTRYSRSRNRMRQPHSMRLDLHSVSVILSGPFPSDYPAAAGCCGSLVIDSRPFSDLFRAIQPQQQQPHPQPRGIHSGFTRDSFGIHSGSLR